MTPTTNPPAFRKAARLAVIGLALAAAPALAQDRSPAAGRGATSGVPAAEVGGQVAPPIEIVAGVEGEAARCEPAELRVPAGQTMDLRIVNKSDQPFTVAAPMIFDDHHLVRFEGDVAHSAGGEGYIVKANGTARIVLRTPAAGEYPFTCANVRNQGTPFRGKLTVVGG